MGDIQPPAPDSEKGPVEAPPIEDLATVVLGMNRFLSRFSTLQAFKDAQLRISKSRRRVNGVRFFSLSRRRRHTGAKTGSTALSKSTPEGLRSKWPVITRSIRRP